MKKSLRIALLVWVMACIGGCASPGKVRPVSPGDRVQVDFTCRLQNGDIAVTTEKRVATDPNLPKSVFYLPRNQNGPLSMTAGSAGQNEPDDPYAPFETRVVKLLAAELTGMTPGGSRTVSLRAEREDERYRPEDIYLTMARSRHRPKELPMESSMFSRRFGKEPVVGEEVVLDEGLPARIAAVEENSVLLSLAALAGRTIGTPFGTALLRETPQDMEIIINAEVGTLVRSGPLAGRISRVNDATFTIDYGHPFGGEDLLCDVALVTVETKGDDTVR